MSSGGTIKTTSFAGVDDKDAEAATTGQPRKVPLERSVSAYSEQDVQCGFWIFRGRIWQRLASKKLYVFLFGFVGCMFGSTGAYFYGTLSTVEKSIQISSKNAGIITAGSDLSFVLASMFLSYYASNKRKPLWIALGIVSMGLSCFVNALPHFLFGPNLEDMVQQDVGNATVSAKGSNNLCDESRLPPDCSTDMGNLKPQMLLFLGSFLSGAGTSLYFTLGLTYLDDNIRKEKVPFLASLAAFGRRLGPMLGFSMASLSLKYFVFPGVDPGYNNSDPRWIGAWWMGWIILGTILLLLAPIFGGFPKILPRAAERKSLSRQASMASGGTIEEEPQVSFEDLKETVKRLLTNKAYVFNNAASVFYMFGYMPYFLFQSKYIEIQYRLTPSEANMVTGSTSLVFSALGLLVAGAVIQRIRPNSRQLAGWNIVTSILSASLIVFYAYLGCNDLNNAAIVSNSQGMECSLGCNCEFVKYAPICGSDGNTYLSPCHAGCREQVKQPDGKILFSDCSCIQGDLNVSYAAFLVDSYNETTSEQHGRAHSGTATSGSCPVDCMTPFYLFLLVLCLNKFIGGTESAANFLIGLRCVLEKDKAISMGLSMAVNTLLSFLPAPIIFGAIIDRTCVLWGQTCSKKGNCWLYDGQDLRKTMNYTSAVFVIIGTCFDLGTWYYSKNFKIFDSEGKVVPEDQNDEHGGKNGTEQEMTELMKEDKERQ